MRKLIIRTTAYEVYQTSTYNFELCVLFHQAYQIYQSLEQPRLITNMFFDDDTNIIHFVAKNAASLATLLRKSSTGHLTSVQAIRSIQCIGAQIAVLERHLCGFTGFDIGDILTLNNGAVIIAVGTKHLAAVEGAYIPMPMRTAHTIPMFHGVEWQKINMNVLYTLTPTTSTTATTPTPISDTNRLAKTVVHEGLGLLILYALFRVRPPSLIMWVQHPQNPIKHTKMHAFLKRCAQSQPLLYI